MAQPLKTPMAPDIPLGNGYTVTFAAIDPTTGAAVSGVTVSNYAIEYSGGGVLTPIETGPFMRVPGPGA